MARYIIGIYTDYAVEADNVDDAIDIAFCNFKNDTGINGVDAIVLDSPDPDEIDA